AEQYVDVSVLDAEVVERENGRVTYQFERSTISASDLIGRLSAQYRIHDLAVREPDIEATIRRIYEEQLLLQ
ncbi:MAG: sugar ABC transporter ATP-binding protein, partial [Chloroflexi bacterium]|nr:sugar ABC transporter ATP-binding protein [Chloroflexota bacterium]